MKLMPFAVRNGRKVGVKCLSGDPEETFNFELIKNSPSSISKLLLNSKPSLKKKNKNQWHLGTNVSDCMSEYPLSATTA